jgi:hypothetical protein
MSRLTSSERALIIAEHLSGKQNKEWIVQETNSKGKYILRKRKEKDETQGETENRPKKSSKPKNTQFVESDDRYDTKDLIKKMYDLMTKNSKKDQDPLDLEELEKEINPAPPLKAQNPPPSQNEPKRIMKRILVLH